MPTLPKYTDLITAQEFKFVETTDADRQTLINEFLANAARDVSEDIYGDRWGRRVVLLALHRLILRDRQIQQLQQQNPSATVKDAFLLPAMGNIQNISASHGASSVSFSQIKAGKEGEAEYYALTEFGREFYAGRRRVPGIVSTYVRECC